MPISNEYLERMMANGFFAKMSVRKAKQRGFEEGRQEAAKSLLTRQLEQDFGALPARLARKLGSLVDHAGITMPVSEQFCHHSNV